MTKEQFTPESLRAIANEVLFTSDGTRIARVHFNEDTITEEEARSYAAQFAASTALKTSLTAALELIDILDDGNHVIEVGAVLGPAREALALCMPLPKGKPFAKFYKPHEKDRFAL